MTAITPPGRETDDIRVAEILGALSLTTDLGAGVPFEKGLRTCVAASGLAGELGLSCSDRRDVYFAALLRSLGCTAHSSTFAALFDDDVVIQRELKMLDLDDPGSSAARAARFATWAGTERARELTALFATEVPAQGASLARGSCEVSTLLGTRLGLPAGAIAVLDEVYERYDGRGFPAGLAGDHLAIAARVVHVAEQAVMAQYEGDGRSAVHHVSRLSGGHLDPDVCAAFMAGAEEILGALDVPDVLTATLAREPQPSIRFGRAEFERVCTAFGGFADLKGRFLLGHSAHVAELADRAAQLSGHDEETRAGLRTSGLLLDLGRVGVSSAIWDRPGRLSPVEWERVRLHPYWTQRILTRCPALDQLAPFAASHHERLDGSGYHRAARGSSCRGAIACWRPPTCSRR